MIKTIVPASAMVFTTVNGAASSGMRGAPSSSMAITLNSIPMMAQSIDRVCFQLNAANSAGGLVPAGSYALQGSVDYALNPDGSVKNGGTFTSMTVAGSLTISAAGTTLINVDSFGVPWLRIQWVPTSGDGVLTGMQAGRSI